MAPPGRPLASCRPPNEVSVLPLANLEKIWRSGGQIWPNDDCFGDCIYFCRAENDLGGDISLAARLSRLVPNCLFCPAVVIAISTFSPSSFWFKSRRQKTHAGKMAAFSVGAFFRGMLLMLFCLLPPTYSSFLLLYDMPSFTGEGGLRGGSPRTLHT